MCKSCPPPFWHLFYAKPHRQLRKPKRQLEYHDGRFSKIWNMLKYFSARIHLFDLPKSICPCLSFNIRIRLKNCKTFFAAALSIKLEDACSPYCGIMTAHKKAKMERDEGEGRAAAAKSWQANVKFHISTGESRHKHCSCYFLFVFSPGCCG